MVTETQSADQQPFHPVNAIIGMVRRPVVTIREIAAVNPLGWGVGTYALSVGINALMALIFLAVFYSIVGAGLLLTFSFRESGLDAGAFLVIFAVVVFVVVYVVFILAASILTSIAIGFLYAGIVYGVAYLLGGRGSFTSVASSLFFSAGVPSLVLSPLNLIFFVGGIFQGLGSFIWSVPLYIITIRETMGLSTNRAAAAVGIPLDIAVLLSTILIAAYILFAGLIQILTVTLEGGVA